MLDGLNLNLGLGGVLVDFARAFGGISEDNHFVRAHFHKTAANRKRKFLPAFFVMQFTDVERGEQRRVARQNSDDAIDARRADVFHVLAQDHALGSYNIEFNR